MISSDKRKQKTRIDREQLRLEITREAGVQLPPDDAILVLIAAHDIVLDSYEERWNRPVKRIERCVNVMVWTFVTSILLGVAYFSTVLWTVL